MADAFTNFSARQTNYRMLWIITLIVLAGSRVIFPALSASGNCLGTSKKEERPSLRSNESLIYRDASRLWSISMRCIPVLFWSLPTA